MFKTLPERIGEKLLVYVDGQPADAWAGETIASVLLRVEPGYCRTSPVSGNRRAPYCMMGVCFDCIAIVDGIASVQTCLMTVRDGMRIERQNGRREVAL